MRFASSTAPVCLGIAVACLSTTASGQVCALKNHMRLVNRVNNGTAGEVRIDTGWTGGPLLATNGVSSDSSPLGSTSASWLATSSYGSLSFSGSGTGTPTPGNGLFMWCDEWIGGEPKAAFKDRLTVVSGSLPVGTPVTIRANAYLSGFTSSSDPSAERTYSASYTGGTLNLAWTNGTGQATQDITVNVGSSVDIQGRLICTLRPYRTLGGGTITDTISAGLTSGISFSVLTPGASITWCSGAPYACPADLGAAGGLAGHDGVLDNNDFIAFINLFFESDPRADLGVQGGGAGSDGQFDNNDFIAFINLFFAGC